MFLELTVQITPKGCNPHLIAAAADLLEVCEAIAAESQGGLRWSSNNISKLTLAIEKAKGQTPNR